MSEPELVPFSKARPYIGVSEAVEWLSRNPDAYVELEAMSAETQDFFGQTHKIGAVLELGTSGAQLAEQALYAQDIINGDAARGLKPDILFESSVVRPMSGSQAGAAYLSQSNVVIIFVPDEEEGEDIKIHIAHLEGSILTCRVLLGIE